VIDPKLYILATPLGNRGDITLRALETLRTLGTFFAEDTREALKLFELYEIPATGKKLFSYAKHNMKEATEKALECLFAGEEIGFMSDRGTPGISDPGYLLVRRAREEGFAVVPIPGVSSVSTALSVCGMNGDRYLFLGFLPDTIGARTKLLQSAGALGHTLCLFESPRRIRETVAELKSLFPYGEIFLGRELTKHFETLTFAPLSEIEVDTLVEKGEYVVTVAPGAVPAELGAWEVDVVQRAMSDRDWSKALAERHGVSAATLYNALQERKGKRPKSE
jgi:16S rRNA (cytidine1402-2'-O)-methyltransferase